MSTERRHPRNQALAELLASPVRSCIARSACRALDDSRHSTHTTSDSHPSPPTAMLSAVLGTAAAPDTLSPRPQIAIAP